MVTLYNKVSNIKAFINLKVYSFLTVFFFFFLPAPTLLVIFTKVLWPPEYFLV